MKKVVRTTVLITLLLATACGEQDIKAEQIEAKIIENSMGSIEDYQPISTTQVAAVKYKDIYDNFFVQMEAEPDPIDQALEGLDNAIETQRKNGNAEVYHQLSFYRDRLTKYKEAEDVNATAYTVLEHKYTFTNPMFNDAKVNVTNYYFFDKNDELLIYVSEDEYKEYKRQYIRHDKAPYEAMLYAESK